MKFFVILILIFSAVTFNGCRPRNRPVTENITEVERSVAEIVPAVEPVIEIIPEATPQTDFVWELHGGTMSITGYNGTGGVVVIPSHINGAPVNVIGEAAFVNKQLTGVNIPESVTDIGVIAFVQNQLTTITIGANVTLEFMLDRTPFDNGFDRVYIDGGMMAGTYTRFNALSTVWSKEGMSEIVTQDDFIGKKQDGAITIIDYKGTNRVVEIPSSINGYPVTTIGGGAFWGKQLTGVIIPNGITTIGINAFAYNQLTNVTIPYSVTTTGMNAFIENQLTSVTIESTVWSPTWLACSFGGGFNELYSSPGTYTRTDVSGSGWTRQE